LTDIDPQFVEDARAGHFPVDDFLNYLNDEENAEIKDHVEEALDNGLSMEWAVMTYESELSPEIEDWSHATIACSPEGEWSVIVIDGGGETHQFTFTDNEAAQDLIWADLYFHLTEYGVEFDKDIDSEDAAT
jgi:hypothetical protein